MLLHYSYPKLLEFEDGSEVKESGTPQVWSRVKICVAQGENASCYKGGGEIAGGGDGAGESAGCRNGNE